MQAHPELGQPVAHLQGRWAAGGWLWYVGGVLIASGVAGVVSAFQEGPDLATSLKNGAGVLAMSWAVGGVMLLICVARWKQRLTIYEHGFHHKKLIGERTVRFAEVSGAQHSLVRSRSGTREHVEVQLKDGRTVTVSDMTDLGTLASMARGAGHGGAR